MCIVNVVAVIGTRALSRAQRTAREWRAGGVWVEPYEGGDMSAPFGADKQSGNGRDSSWHVFDEHTEPKPTWIKL